MKFDDILDLPTSIELTGELINCLLDALSYMKDANKKRGKNFLLENYTIDIALDDGEKQYVKEYLYMKEAPDRFVVFHFFPKLTENNLIQGIPFAVSDNGMYGNGLGVSLVYDINKCLLLRSLYMR